MWILHFSYHESSNANSDPGITRLISSQQPKQPAKMAPNELFQYSTANALMDGVATKGLLISSILQHGDHGIGTFRHMVGELTIVDGVAWAVE
ncbi:acetolactate decarboxylase [Diaporthe helianthi]|uniref:Alpha-acetolactate decarboxylase n=1 Tax=Diaporthe helianthi TaxID=158607 RepID=A0A2P5I8Z0_DIAHE|nr:acetolactate decarboxylase [Diaporthe helianthi]